MKYDALVFIGRFQPFHNGHKAIVDAALKQAKEVIIVVGSSFASRNIRNPFTFDERRQMIKSVFPRIPLKLFLSLITHTTITNGFVQYRMLFMVLLSGVLTQSALGLLDTKKMVAAIT